MFYLAKAFIVNQKVSIVFSGKAGMCKRRSVFFVLKKSCIEIVGNAYVQNSLVLICSDVHEVVVCSDRFHAVENNTKAEDFLSSRGTRDLLNCCTAAQQIPPSSG